MTHGIEPILPFDLALATYLVPNLTSPLSTVDLIATRARQLQTQDEDLATIREDIVKSRLTAAQKSKQQFANTIKTGQFTLGDLVLVRNSAVKNTHQKMKPRYFSPMVMVKRTRNGAYCLASLDGTVSCLCFTAFRLIPYHARSHSTISVTCLLDSDDLDALDSADEDNIGTDEDA